MYKKGDKVKFTRIDGSRYHFLIGKEGVVLEDEKPLQKYPVKAQFTRPDGSISYSFFRLSEISNLTPRKPITEILNEQIS